MKKITLILITILFLVSCTSNNRAKNWGGSEEVTLNKNEILLNVTWKEANMWVLTKDTTTNICYFREHSSWGVLEGQITFK